MMMFGGSPHIVAEPPEVPAAKSPTIIIGNRIALEATDASSSSNCRQKQDDRNTVDEHRQYKRHQHKRDKYRQSC